MMNSLDSEPTALIENEVSIDDIKVEAPATEKGSSWYVSVFLVVNAALGAGLLNFPAAYHQSGGLVVAISIQAVLIFFVIGSLLILTYCSDVHRSATYQDVVLIMCGKKMKILCSVFIALYCFGTCITFFIIIGDQWDKFLTFVYGPTYCHHWYMSRTFTMVSSCILFVLPLCFPRRIDFLKYVSAIGVLAIVYCVFLVTIKYFVGTNHPGPIRTSPERWTDVFIVVPVICFGYQCHLSVIPIYACLEKRKVTEFSKTLLVAMALCLIAYTAMASFGYLTFGGDVNDDILLSYKPTADVLVAVALIAVKMYTTYPILLFVGRMAIESIILDIFNVSPATMVSGEKKRRVITVLVWFSCTLLIAVIVPDIGAVISLLGGLAALFAFTFPGLCLLQVLLRSDTDENMRFSLTQEDTTPEAPPFKRYGNYVLYLTCIFYIVIGVFIFGLVTTQSLMSDILSMMKPIHPSHSSQCS